MCEAFTSPDLDGVSTCDTDYCLLDPICRAMDHRAILIKRFADWTGNRFCWFGHNHGIGTTADRLNPWSPCEDTSLAGRQGRVAGGGAV